MIVSYLPWLRDLGRWSPDLLVSQVDVLGFVLSMQNLLSERRQSSSSCATPLFLPAKMAQWQQSVPRKLLCNVKVSVVCYMVTCRGFRPLAVGQSRGPLDVATAAKSAKGGGPSIRQHLPCNASKEQLMNVAATLATNERRAASNTRRTNIWWLMGSIASGDGIQISTTPTWYLLWIRPAYEVEMDLARPPGAHALTCSVASFFQASFDVQSSVEGLHRGHQDGDIGNSTLIQPGSRLDLSRPFLIRLAYIGFIPNQVQRILVYLTFSLLSSLQNSTLQL